MKVKIIRFETDMMFTRDNERFCPLSEKEYHIINEIHITKDEIILKGDSILLDGSEQYYKIETSKIKNIKIGTDK